MSVEPASAGPPPGGVPRPQHFLDWFCAAGLVTAGVSSLALKALIPSLLATNPVLLESFTGSIAAMVTSGAFARVGRTSIELAVLAAIPGVMMFDPFYWLAGNRWGRGAADLLTRGSPRMARGLDRTERITRRYGKLAVALGYVLPVPNGLIYAAAGWTGMRFRTFLVLDVLGALLWIAIVVGVGYWLGQGAVDVAEAISRYALILTIALVVGIVGWQMWQQSRIERVRR